MTIDSSEKKLLTLFRKMDVDLKKVCVKNTQEMFKNSTMVSLPRKSNEDNKSKAGGSVVKISEVSTIAKKDDRLSRDKVNKKLLKEKMDRLKIKIKSAEIKNKNMHYTENKKINTIHDINKYIKSGEVINFSKDRKILNIVNNLLGEKSSVRNIEFFLKPRKTGLRSAFHQDNAYWNFSDEKKALNVWIACSESNFKNGGVCYYRKSH